MTFDPTKPVQTRDGCKARVICTDRRSLRYPIVAVVDEGGDSEEIRSYTADGRQFDAASGKRGSDLINVPETKSSWVAVVDGQPRSVWEYRSDIERFVKCSVIELRMCDGKLVEAIQHEV